MLVEEYLNIYPGVHSFIQLRALIWGEAYKKNVQKYILYLKWSFQTESSQSGISVNNDLP